MPDKMKNLILVWVKETRMMENKTYNAIVENLFQQRELLFSLRKVNLVDSRFAYFSERSRKVILVTPRFTDFSKRLRKVILVKKRIIYIKNYCLDFPLKDREKCKILLCYGEKQIG